MNSSGPGPRIVVIAGPTATGKSRTALAAARALGRAGRPAEIVSMDAVQVYRGMDIGTDKLAESEREGIPHRLIDVADPDETFSAAEFGRRTDEVIERSERSGDSVVVAGGTGFYLRVLIHGLFPGPAADPELRARLYREAESDGLSRLYERLLARDPSAGSRVHPHDHVRIVRALEVLALTGRTMSEHFAAQRREGPRYRALIIGLQAERELMYDRINARVEQMMARGLVEEVEGLRARGYGRELASQQALGYQQVHALLDGEIDRERAAYLIQRDTRHYSRRQLTWLRKEPGLEWMAAGDTAKIVDRAVRFMEGDG
jgi:tRNA dimethylallyltransferase